MKAIRSIFVLASILLTYSCNDKAQTANEKAERDLKAIQSWETNGKDTINRTDFAKQKQGHWEIRKFVACTKTVQTIYHGEQGIHTKISKGTDIVKLEEGMYLDNKREGLWKIYFPSGSLKDSIVYKNDVAIN